MTNKTIKKLNQLNTKFYNTIASDFSDSRKYSWEGWQKIIPVIKSLVTKNKKVKVLDLGCGNGRFAKFLNINFPKTKFDYLGIDNSSDLLSIAKEKFKYKFKKVDLVESLISNSLANKLNNKKYDLIVAMGLMHHIPSFELRIKLIKILANLVNKNGYIILAFWQFHKSERLMRKIVNPELVNINKENLEENDYVLDWQRGKTAYRYCHNFTDNEIEKLIKESGLELVSEFNADGKEKLNKYLILRKEK